MVRRRLTRDPHTGESYYYDVDTGEPIDYDLETSKHIDDYQEGDGIIDSLTSVAKKVASKLTGKVAKDVAKKAVTKAAEKSAEQIGEKTGELIGEKLYKFSKKPTEENKGDQIIELLQSHPNNTKIHSNTEKPVPKQENIRYRLLSQEFNKLIHM